MPAYRNIGSETGLCAQPDSLALLSLSVLRQRYYSRRPIIIESSY